MKEAFKNIDWPTSEEVMKKLGLVLLVMIVLILVIAGLDGLFGYLLGYIY